MRRLRVRPPWRSPELKEPQAWVITQGLTRSRFDIFLTANLFHRFELRNS